jgi:UDP-2,4-diacetamido-2,4,6-trideoxy-beta-L-altropyranose hydrolase
MRCMTLASSLAKRGASCTFYSDPETRDFLQLGNAFELVSDEGIDDKLTDGKFGRFDVFICDHYGLDAKFERALRPNVGTLVVIDDLADRRHDCDLLVDMTLSRPASLYDGLVPHDALVLTGIDYALIRPEFAALRQESLARRGSGRIGRILISFGLTDPQGLCATAVDLVREICGQLPDFRSADIMIGPQSDRLAELQRRVAGDARFNVHAGPANPALLMAQADLAIGAGGTTSWERCCLGLPTVLVSIADNQRAIAGALQAAGAVVLLPSLQSFRADLPAVLTRLGQNPGEVVKLGASAAGLCDGQGADRVAEHIFCIYESRRTGAERG